MKKPYTPNTQIRSCLRVLWMRSRERNEALKNTDMCCSVCGDRNSRAKGREIYIEVHHLKHVTNWARIFSVIREELLCDPSELTPMCKPCHKEWHEKEEK